MLAINAGSLLALGRVAWDDNITHFDPCDTSTDALNNTSGFMPKNAGESAFRIASVKPVHIGMAECVGDDLDPDLSFLGGGDPDVFDLHGLLCGVGDGCLA